ncbi:hypothetical protein K3495_g8801 [Podosphaera aphanis]|nr:hypothetical protein K3495_g8801 [Podosphaera aphanis]
MEVTGRPHTPQDAVSADAKFNEYSFRNINTTKYSQSSTEDILKRTSGRPKGVEQKSEVYTLIHAIKTDTKSPSVRNAYDEGHNPGDGLSRGRNADKRIDHPKDGSSNPLETGPEKLNPPLVPKFLWLETCGVL